MSFASTSPSVFPSVWPVPPPALLSTGLTDRSALYHKAAYSEISPALQRALEQKFLKPGETFVGSKCLTGGLSNSNYRWETSSLSYLCKICNEKPAEELRRHMRILRLIKQRMEILPEEFRTPIAYPVPFQSELKKYSLDDPDHYLLEFSESSTGQPTLVVFYEFLSGFNPKSPNSSICRQMARGQSIIHRVSGNVKEFEELLGHNKFPLGEVERFVNDIRSGKLSETLINSNKMFLDFVQAEFEALKPFLRELDDSSKYPYSLNHGDLFLENVMFDDSDRLTGFIDFEEMFFGPRVLDIAVTWVGSLFTDSNEFLIELAADYLAEYVKHTSLSQLEWNSLYAALRYCLLGISCWFFELFHIRQPDSHPVRALAHIPLLQQLKEIPVDLVDRLRALVSAKDPMAAFAASTTLSSAAQMPEPLSMEEFRSVRDNLMGFNTVYSYTKSRSGPLHLSHGLAQYMFTVTGQKYLDAYNNVTHVGHSHPAIQQAAAHQLTILNTNTRYAYDILPHYLRELLKTLPPELGLSDKEGEGGVVFFCNSGSEANDLALRMASELAGRSREFIVIDHAYHGVSTQVLEVSPYLFNGPGGFGKESNIHIADIPDTYRGKYRIEQHSEEKCAELYAGSVAAKLGEISNSGKKIAAFLHEAVIGCGGQIPFPSGYLQRCYSEVRAAGGFCIADEVQTGFGRTGEHFWAFQAHGIIPDFITLGKPMGNGFPLAGVICRKSLAEKLRNSVEWFSSCGGSPLSCRVGYTVCRIVEEEKLQERANNTGKYLLKKLKELQLKAPEIGNVRGSGLFLGCEFIDPKASKPGQPPVADPVCSAFVVNYLRDNPQRVSLAEIESEMPSMGPVWPSSIHREDYKVAGILCGTDGYAGNVIKIKPPMVFNSFDSFLLVRGIEKALELWRNKQN